MTDSYAKIFKLKVGDRNLALSISNVRNDVKLPSSRCFMLCISAAYTSPPALHFSDKVHEALSELARGHGRNQWPALTWRNQNPFVGQEFLFFFLDLTLWQVTQWWRPEDFEVPEMSLRFFPGDGKVCIKWLANHKDEEDKAWRRGVWIKNGKEKMQTQTPTFQ